MLGAPAIALVQADGVETGLERLVRKTSNVVRVAGAFKAVQREDAQETRVPVWLSFDPSALSGTVSAFPSYDAHELLFDLEQVFEYYSR